MFEVYRRLLEARPLRKVIVEAFRLEPDHRFGRDFEMTDSHGPAIRMNSRGIQFRDYIRLGTRQGRMDRNRRGINAWQEARGRQCFVLRYGVAIACAIGSAH